MSNTDNTTTLYLKKPIVIPAGTVFHSAAGVTRMLGAGQFETTLGLTKDSYGTLTYSVDDDRERLQEWFCESVENVDGFGVAPKTFLSDAVESGIIADKQLRVDIDAILQRVKALPPSRERSLARTKLEEAVMWLGMDLKRLGTPNPYPNSRDVGNTIVDPTADGLKL